MFQLKRAGCPQTVSTDSHKSQVHLINNLLLPLQMDVSVIESSSSLIEVELLNPVHYRLNEMNFLTKKRVYPLCEFPITLTRREVGILLFCPLLMSDQRETLKDIYEYPQSDHWLINKIILLTPTLTICC